MKKVFFNNILRVFNKGINVLMIVIVYFLLPIEWISDKISSLFRSVNNKSKVVLFFTTIADMFHDSIGELLSIIFTIWEYWEMTYIKIKL